MKGIGIGMVTLGRTIEARHLILGKTFWQSLHCIPVAQKEKHGL